MWAIGRNKERGACVERGARNHIEEEALCVRGMGRADEVFDVININEIAAPIIVTINGKVLYCKGKKGSCSIGISSQLIALPLKMAPIVKRDAGMEMFVSWFEIA